GELAVLGLTDPAALRRAISQAAAGLPTHFGFLETTLACDAWLRALRVAQPIRWTSVHPKAAAG
ncbi:MAG: albusnodin/ikarugamycin family macrolactam cyclase, partial [Gammaproteobacteria bacterium]